MSIVVRKMDGFQLVGGRPFVVAKKPVLEESLEGCAGVVETAVVDEKI